MAKISDYTQVIQSETLTISAGQTQTPAFRLNGTTLSKLVTPAGLTGTALTFTGAFLPGPGQTVPAPGFFQLTDPTTDAAFSLQHGLTARMYYLNPQIFYGIYEMRIDIGGVAAVSDFDFIMITYAI